MRSVQYAMDTVAHGNFSGRRLIVFGAGYIGSAVAEQARAAGASVTGLTRNAATADALRSKGIEAVVADLDDEGWYSQIKTTPNFVLYCASAGGLGLAGYRRSYLAGIETVLRWLESEGQVATFVYTSSTSVYPQSGGIAVDERAAIVPPSEERTGILAATEDAVKSAQKAAGRSFILRLSGIYGPSRHTLLDEVRSGTVSGSSDNRLNLVHRDDAVSAILKCFAAPPSISSAIFNVSDGSPATRGEIAEWVANQLRLPMPQFSGVAPTARRSVPLDRVIVSAKARRELGWAPRYASFREGYVELLREPAAPRV